VWAVSPPINGCYHPHPPSPFVIITQPESWYSFYHPTQGGRLSQPRHCRKGAQPMPKAVHRSGCRDKHNWPRPFTPQSIMPSLNHCDLLRHVGVKNLPEVVTRQRRGWELNSQPVSCKSNALVTRLPSHPMLCCLPSNRHHLSSGDCLEGKGENYQVCSVQYCVQQLCTVRCTHIW